MKKKLSFLLPLLIFGLSKIFSQSVEAQLLEINFYGDSYPKNFTQFDGKIYFTALNNQFSRNLWVHDPATNQTYTIGDYGPIDGELTIVDNTLYFTKNVYNNELWKTNGTAEGTSQVKILEGNGYVSLPTAYNGKLYFISNDIIYGNEIWVSDGTEAGTHIFKDINPGDLNSNAKNLFVFNGSLYFTANNTQTGIELWKSDGTETGTVLLKDIAPGATPANPGKSIIFNNNFYFFASTSANGNELWKSNGTAEGTVLFKEFVAGPTGVSNYYDGLDGIAVSNDYFVFTARYNNSLRLYKSDGTIEGTEQIKIVDIPADGFENFSGFTVHNNKPYFIGTDFSDTGSQLWTTDGSVAGTELAVDTELLNAGNISHLTTASDYLIFYADNGTGHPTPWVSDGTQEGTHLLKDVNLYSTSAGNMDFVTISNKTYFPAGYGSLNGVEFWSTDGTEQNTNIIKDLFHSYAGTIGGAGKFSATVLNDNLIFAGNNGLSGSEPFITDGTADGTHIIKDLYSGEYSSCGFTNEHTHDIFIKAGNKLFFNGSGNGTGAEIFVTDGTAEGTKLVKDISPGTTSSVNGYTYFMSYNDIFYFKGNDNIHGDELWRTDGTDEGTWLVKDINPGLESGVTASNGYTNQNINYAVCNGFMYFVANDGTGAAVWKTDGTTAGTIKVITLPSTNEPVIINANNSKIFITTVGLNVLYGSDGTQDGTLLLQSDIDSNYLHFLYNCVVNNELYYNVNTNTTGRSIFRSDGTPAGTILVKGNLATTTGIKFMKSCGDYIFFGLGSNDFTFPYSNEIWRTDGTANGTLQLTLTEDGNQFGDYDCLGNNLVFLKPYAEPYFWISDGTAANTNPVDITVSNAPPFQGFYGLSTILGIVGTTIYLEGLTQESGAEMYVANIEGLLNTPSVSSGHTGVDNVLLYPNPGNDIITLSSVNNTIINSIDVYDVMGKKVLEQEGGNTNVTFSVLSLSKGIYFVKVKTGDGIITKKLMRN